MSHTTRLVSALAALVVGLAGCSSKTPGDANPEVTADRGDVPDGAPTTPGDSTPDTADLQPCDLLSEADLTALDLPREHKEERDVGAGRGCQWQTSGSHTVTIGIFDELGIDDVVATNPEPVDVGSREAVRYSTGGTCAVAIAVTGSSRVDVMGTANGDLTTACRVATTAAELVAAKLP